MCLEVYKVNNELPIKIAEKDIPCLKILEVSKAIHSTEKDIPCSKILEISKAVHSDDTCYTTPYRGVQVPPEVLRGEKNFLPERCKLRDYVTESHRDSDFRQCAEVSAGAIHTFACVEDSAQTIAAEICFLCRFVGSRVLAVYLCVIPEGTEYMEGVYDKRKCYGSKAIRFERELLKYDKVVNYGKLRTYDKVRQELAPVIKEIVC